MKKHIISIILTLSLSACMLAGCNGSAGDTAKTEGGAEGAAQTEAGEQSSDASQAGAQSADASTGEAATGDYGPLISELKLSDYITLGEYKNLKVDGGNPEPTEEDIEQAVAAALESSAEEKEVDRPIKEGDIANIDFEGKLNGVPFDGGTSQGFDLTIGSHSFIDGFEDGLIGAKKGETRDLNLTFPENYQSAELAGKAVVFTVKVNYIREKVVPELTDELAKTLNEKANTAEEYKKLLADDLRVSNQEALESETKTTLLNMAVENATIKSVPEGLINEQVDIAMLQAASYAQGQGISTEDFLSQYYGATVDEFKQQYRSYAEEGAKQMLTVFAIAEAEGMVLSQADAEKELKQYMDNLGYTDYKEFIATVDGRGCYEYIHYDKVNQFLYDNADITKS